MKKEKWINTVLESTKGMERQQASPFLFEKIANRLEQDKLKSNSPVPALKWAFGCAAVIFITVNVISVTRAVSDKKVSNKETGMEQPSSELNNAVIYNY